jgi:hypothetical protein
MTQTRGAQSLSGKQAVSHQGAAQAVQIFKEQARFFKSSFFAAGIHMHKHLGRGQDGCESVHHLWADYATSFSTA